MSSNLDDSTRSVIKKSIWDIIIVSMSAVRIKKLYLESKQMKVRYMGHESDHHVFSLIRSIHGSNILKEDGFQVTLHADKKSREIVAAETVFLSKEDITLLDFSTKYRTHSEGFFAKFYHPYEIKGSALQEKNKINFFMEIHTVSDIHGRK